MITPEQKRKSLKAARLYLEMRGYKLLEQGWSSGKYRIDLIVSKDGLIEFAEVNYAKEGETLDSNETETKIKARTAAAEAWAEENKHSGKYGFTAIEVYGLSYIILGVNQL